MESVEIITTEVVDNAREKNDLFRQFYFIKQMKLKMNCFLNCFITLCDLRTSKQLWAPASLRGGDGVPSPGGATVHYGKSSGTRRTLEAKISTLWVFWAFMCSLRVILKCVYTLESTMKGL